MKNIMIKDSISKIMQDASTKSFSSPEQNSPKVSNRSSVNPESSLKVNFMIFKDEGAGVAPSNGLYAESLLNLSFIFLLRLNL